jgi:CubicO group peptidase (beta-lactamase class C family)
VFERIDEIFRDALAKHTTPTIAYGVVVDGELVHVGGIADDGHDVPGADHVFRIASMTKSFTAATIVLLRDEGELRLDDPVEMHVPELENLALPTADSPALTIRHLLTMSGGLPTDDPWADRQESMTSAEFDELLRTRLAFIAAPGTTFEYSNLGYSILGRVISNVAGTSYQEAVRTRFLQPLDMAQSTFDVFAVPDDRRMQGYRRVDGAWSPEPFTAPGEFSALGGLCSTVRDLSRWVGWLASAARHVGPTAPLSPASRREMMQQHRSIAPAALLSVSEGTIELTAAGYGFGLVVEQHPRFGDIASHSGGYPGFGSHMRWHLATGTGVIALSNGTYSGMTRPASLALDAALHSFKAPSRSVSPWSATWTTRRQVQRLLREWDDDLADELFADNVDLDEPRDRRRAAIAQAVDRVGPPVADVDDVIESQTAAALSWVTTCQRGSLRVSITMTPHEQPLLQTLSVRAVPNASATLTDAVGRVTAALAADPPHWPPTLSPGPQVDIAELLRAARAAAALGTTIDAAFPPIAGDGVTTATVRVGTESIRWQLMVTIDPSTLLVTACTLTPAPLRAADHTATPTRP